MVTGDGNFPLNASYYRRRRRRSGTDMLYKSFVSGATNASTIFNDFFFEAASAPTSSLKIKVGGVFASLVSSKVKVSGTFISYTPQIKTGGTFV
jgi:hypothetical protein